MTTNYEEHLITTTGGDKIRISLSVPLLRADNLGLITWGGAYVLANILHRLPIPDPPTDGLLPVLELGAGTGLVGITAAILWKTRVVLTDLEPIVPDLFLERGGSALSGTLDWNEPRRLLIVGGADTANDELNKASVILCADTMYTEEHPGLISQTIFAQLKRRPTSRAVACYPMRVAYLDAMREFYERMEEGGMILVEEGREELLDERWMSQVVQ
ncbi:hypothetical protein BKA62DRAFT_742951 [Auriculariales sp. MPI-PUGE-AT-0066]|nr:hypothetical protein BKA62DRAFT_742951 [Auriculariales sp. MPI-PUGE-AT-0066]